MKFTILLISLILLAGCDEDQKETTPLCPDIAIEALPWIADLKNSMTNCSCELSIIKGTYRNNIVVFIELTDPLCNGINTPILYNCEGKPIRSFSSSEADQKELTDNVTRDSVLYRCKT